MMRTVLTLLCLVFFLSFNSCARRVVVRQPAANVTVVKTLPKHYKVVRVNGKRYYFWNGRHYRKTRNGYVVVRV